MASQKRRARESEIGSISERKNDPDQPFVTSVELAEIIGVELETIKNWIRRDVITRATIGGRVLRTRLFSTDEVCKAALIHELVELGIAPSIAGETVNALWIEWRRVRVPNGTHVYVALRPDKQKGWSVFFWQKQVRELSLDFPTQAFVVIPISDVTGETMKRFERLTSAE
jgi:hypothetical protein